MEFSLTLRTLPAPDSRVRRRAQLLAKPQAPKIRPVPPVTVRSRKGRGQKRSPITDFDNNFDDHEWRWQTPSAAPAPKPVPAPAPPPPTPVASPADLSPVDRQQPHPTQPNLTVPGAVSSRELNPQTAPHAVANSEQNQPEAPVKAADDTEALTMKAPRP